MDPNANKSRTDYPVGGVSFVEARGVRKWTIPFKVTAKE
jgi:hypothetical protein